MRRHLTAVVGLALLALVAVIALAARELPRPNAAPRLDIRWDLVSLGINVLVAVVVIGFVIWLMLPGGKRRRRKRREGRTSSIAGAIILLAILVVLMRLGGFTIDSEETSTTTTAANSVATVETQTAEPPPPAGSGVGLIVVAAALAVVVVAILGQNRRPAGVEIEVDDARELVADAIDELLARFDQSDDPRRVVIGAYARMERVLAAGGVEKKRSESPRQYLERVLGTLDVTDQSIVRLTDLFEEARFSPHDIDLSMALEARAALAGIREQLGAPR